MTFSLPRVVTTACALVVLVRAAPGFADATTPDSTTAGSADQRLLEAIRRAVRDRLAPTAVEARVGRAVINTSRPGDRAILEHANIITDDKHGDPLPLHLARDVAYWIRPIGGHNPRIAGILWHPNGTPEVFLGAVLPP